MHHLGVLRFPNTFPGWATRVGSKASPARVSVAWGSPVPLHPPTLGDPQRVLGGSAPPPLPQDWGSRVRGPVAWTGLARCIFNWGDRHTRESQAGGCGGSRAAALSRPCYSWPPWPPTPPPHHPHTPPPWGLRQPLPLGPGSLFRNSAPSPRCAEPGRGARGPTRLRYRGRGRVGQGRGALQTQHSRAQHLSVGGGSRTQEWGN